MQPSDDRSAGPLGPTPNKKRSVGVSRFANPANPLPPAEVIEQYLATAIGSPEEILAHYCVMRRSFMITREAHSERALDLAAQVLKGKRVSQKVVRKLLGGQDQALTHTMGLLALRLGRLPSLKSGLRDLAHYDLENWMLSVLGALPETCLDEEFGSSYKRPDIIHCQRINAIKIAQVRLLAAMALFVVSANDRSSFALGKVCANFLDLDELLIGAGATPENDGSDVYALSEQIIHDAIDRFVRDETISAHSRSERIYAWRKRKQMVEYYLQNYPEINKRYLSLQLPDVFENFRSIGYDLHCQADVLAAQRRDESCAPVADDPLAFYAVMENRYNEVTLIRSSFDEQCALITEGKVDFSQGLSRFSVTLPRANEIGLLSGGTWTLHFAVASLRYLREHIGPLRKGLYKASKDSNLYLVYLGPETQCDIVPFNGGVKNWEENCHEPPMLAMYKAGCFLFNTELRSQTLIARSKFLPASVWPSSDVAYSTLRDLGADTRDLQVACYKSGITLLPIGAWHFTTALGRAMSRSVLRGARFGEVLQQRIGPGSFQPHVDRKNPIWKWEAIGKGKKAPEPYFLSIEDLNAVDDLVKIMRRNGWQTREVYPRAEAKEKCDKGRYLYQRNGYLVTDNAIALSVSLLFWPHYVTSHDLRHGMARHLRRTGASLEMIATMLHHKLSKTASRKERRQASAITRKYAPPTGRMRAELVRILVQSGAV